VELRDNFGLKRKNKKTRVLSRGEEGVIRGGMDEICKEN